jgi:hypothetical protein
MLRLQVVSRRGHGQLSGVTTIQRINTRGGVASEPCNMHHALQSVPYTADYAFYSKRSTVAPAGE